jgi:DNA-binding NarL/FixJ family response regulator
VNVGGAPKSRLLIADRAPARLRIRRALEGEVQVCAEADTTEAAITAAEHQQPDLCMIGDDLPGGPVPATRGICSAAPRAAIVVLARRPCSDDLMACLRAGAIGYLSAGISRTALRRIASAALRGEAAVSRSMVLELIRELQVTARSGAAGLSRREAEVLSLLRRGHPTAVIAANLGISPVTVRRHVSATMRKTRSADRGALARTARRA